MIIRSIRGRSRRHALRFCWLAGICLTGHLPAFAQETSSPDETADATHLQDSAVRESSAERLVYIPADFTQFAPRSALDMLQQVPGFTIDDPQTGNGNGGGGNHNNQDTRGLGQASGNVLLNGARFTSKSDSITSQLARIAAADVVRIELIDGATLDLPGMSGRVANVVALNSGGISGQFEWKANIREKYAPSSMKGVSGSVTGSSGPLTYVLALENAPFLGGAVGPDVITFADGRVENRINTIRPRRQVQKVSGSVRLDGATGWGASLGGQYRKEQFHVRETDTWQIATGAPQATDLIRIASPEDQYEINGEFAFGFGPGRLKLIGLLSQEDDEFAQQQIIDLSDGNGPFGSRFVRVADSTEKIVRLEYDWGMLGGDWQLSGEGAYNSLDQVASFSSLNPDGTFDGTPFPPGTGLVSEDRYETLLFHGRPLNGELTMQLTLGGEYSKITQSGVNALARSFLRPKGSFGLAWAARAGTDISFNIAREVGQLDFEDILGAVNLGDDNTNAGNNRLRPEQKWTAKLETAQSFGAWGSATLTLFRNKVTDYVTIIPLPGGGEAIGNIPSAKEYGVQLVGTLRLDQAGLRGAKVDIDGTLQKSSLSDPTTGDKRGFDKYEPRQLDISYRHDIPRSSWAYGGEYIYAHNGPYYRVAEVGVDYNREHDLKLFIENKDVFGLTVNVSASNLLHNKVVLDREVTAGPRGVSPVLFSQSRRRVLGEIYEITIKGNF